MIRLGVLIIGLILAAVAIWHPVPRAPAATVTAAATTRPPRSRSRAPRAHHPVLPTAVVYVVGAVAHPGLYRLATTSRIDDAVRAAGGMREGADPAGVDLAARIADGDEVDVPRMGESIPRKTSSRRAVSGVRRRTRKSKNVPPGAVDINAADAAALATVPGIGPAIAQRIVELRDREGAYSSFDELLDVAGMSPARLDHARPYLTL